MHRAAIVILALLVSACGLHKKKPSGPVTSTAEVKDIYYQAEMAFVNGNYNEAKTLFTRFVKESPKPGSGYYRLASIEKIEKNYDEALRYCNLALQTDPENAYAINLLQADVYRATRQYALAGNIYQSLTYKNPQFWSLHSDAANMYKMAGNGLKMANAATRMESVFGIREEIAFFYAYAFSLQNKRDSVPQVYERLANKYPERRQYKLSYARALQDAGRKEKAMAIYQEMLASDPENAELLSALCKYYNGNTSSPQYWQLVKKAVASHQLNINDKQGCLSPFLSRENNPYFDSLQPVLVTLTQMHPTESNSWQMLADWCYEKGNYPAAMNAYSQGLHIFSNYQGWLKYSDCLYRLRYYSRMLSATDSMSEFFPSNPVVYNLRAKSLDAMGKWKNAKEECETGLSFSVDKQNITELNITLASALNHMGKRAESISLLQNLAKENRQNTIIQLALAEVLIDADSLQAAASQLKSTESTAATNADLHAQWLILNAGYQLKNGDKNKALDLLKNATQAHPGNALAWEKLGEILMANGQLAAAKDAFKKASQLAPGSEHLLQKAQS